MRIVVLSVGRLKPPFADDVEHYRRLLSRQARLELVEVREDEAVARRIPERAHVVALDDRGRAHDSEGFARWMEGRRQSGLDLCFVLGGPFGHGPGGARADEHLSLGPMTLPHQLARVVLLEQIFRAHKILAGEPYHH
ncbi:MAG: 23S rRNA (pseudouridine(1915)-N(3))-methyltransferase RlmH [Actinomycetota bacterium]|nr:23S rRNA (pseudouridine(1915)-N(3))-methyltransferase RlmH [Actinomycetota bacterium]